ncbi:hypothetical protein [Bacteroides hominis]|uniref:hypothetical protein n=1 Tax=Bacteroides hominis TaxID=2763023 RepID=UPI002292938C|nr:hypothetical protein [Bacteroides fragilis]
MKRRCCYIESLFLAGIICLSACGSKNPGVSKEELKKNLSKTELKRILRLKKAHHRSLRKIIRLLRVSNISPGS